MAEILVVYATTEGHTRKVAEFIAERVRARGHHVDLVDAATPAVEHLGLRYRAAFVGGSVHCDRHQGALLHFARRQRAWLNAMPVAFFSVGLALVQPDAGGVEAAREAADRFVEQTGLRPARVHLVAGALKYTQYDFFKRWVMRTIAAREGRSVDTGHDHEYTDWADVGAFVDAFLALAGERRPEVAATATGPGSEDER